MLGLYHFKRMFTLAVVHEKKNAGIYNRKQSRDLEI